MSQSFSDEDEYPCEYEIPVSTDKVLDRATEILDKLRYYAWSRGLSMLMDKHSFEGLCDLISDYE